MNYEEFKQKLSRGVLKYNGILNSNYEWYNKETCCRQSIFFDTIVDGISNEESRPTKEIVNELRDEISFSRKYLGTKKLENIHISQKHIPDPEGKWFMGYQADKDGRITFETNNGLFLVISKNPVDINYCTSDQPYASCYKASNSYNFLTSFVLKTVNTKYVWISFITDGSKRISEDDDAFVGSYDYGDGNGSTHIDLHQEHFIYKGRAWIYVDNTGANFMVGRPYGKYGYELRDAIRRLSPTGLTTFELDNTCFYQTYDNISYNNVVFDKYNSISDSSLIININPFSKVKKNDKL